jgi:hypothetical protein
MGESHLDCMIFDDFSWIDFSSDFLKGKFPGKINPNYNNFFL